MASKSNPNWGTVDLQTQAKKEEKEKQRKRAEVILRTWELLEAQDKEERHVRLKAKVELQRQLIGKVDQHWRHLRVERLEKKNHAELKLSTVLQQQVAAAYHQRPSRHSHKPTTVLVVQRPPSVNDSDTAAIIQTVPAGNRDEVIHAAKPDERTPGNVTRENTIGYTNQLFQYPENKILKYLGIEQSQQQQVKIEDMWLHLKSHSHKQLRPLQIRLDRLEQRSSPSIKECLKLYNQPTPCDYYTGKSIVLSDALNELRSTSQPHRKYALRISKSLATLKSKCGQKMLERPGFRQDNESSNEDWFVGLPATSQKDRPKSAPTSLVKEQRVVARYQNSIPSRVHHQKLAIKKSIAVPSQTTAVVIEDDSIHWEPLSLTALEDSIGVQNKLTSGRGQFRNGRVSVWKHQCS